jgi:DNA-binding transcriptional ArsR family regulator
MESMVKCLRALGDENRLRILMLLRERELCVLEVVAALGISQPLASSHLAVLREAGLATARREGRRIRYGLSGEAARQHRLLQVAGRRDEESSRRTERIAECVAFAADDLRQETLALPRRGKRIAPGFHACDSSRGRPALAERLTSEATARPPRATCSRRGRPLAAGGASRRPRTCSRPH